MLKAIDQEDVDAGAKKVYFDFLRGMFTASEKTRSELYRSSPLEANIEPELNGAEFGNGIKVFYSGAIKSVHKEHLLVFYSAGLL